MPATPTSLPATTSASARQASRSAISAKPTGSASCPTQAGTFGGDDRAGLALADDELHGAPREDGRHARGHGRRNTRRRRAASLQE